MSRSDIKRLLENIAIGAIILALVLWMGPWITAVTWPLAVVAALALTAMVVIAWNLFLAVATAVVAVVRTILQERRAASDER